MEAKIGFALLAIFISHACAVVVKVNPCDDANAAVCTVDEVRVVPCPLKNTACVLKKGRAASIAFDFTPKFSANTLKSMVYLDKPELVVPFGGFDEDACKTTACPVQSGAQQTYNYQLEISRRLPSGSHPIKWVVWNEQNESESCCFKMNIKLQS